MRSSSLICLLAPRTVEQRSIPNLHRAEGKLDALVNLVTHLAANQKPASVARVYGIRSSNDHRTSTTTAAETRHLIEKMAPNSYQFSARNDAIIIRGVHDVATNTSAKTRMLKGKLDALVNFVTQLASNQKLVSVARTTTTAETRHLIEKMAPNSDQFSARNDAIVIRGVHDVATNTSTETRKLEGKQDALVNLVTHLAANQKPASVARVYDIRSSNDHRTSATTAAETRHLIEKMTPNSYQFNARNDAIIIRGVHDVATNTSAKARMLKFKLDALVNFVIQLAANQKLVSVTTTTAETRHLIEKMAPNSYQFSARNDAIVIRGVHDVATNTSAETRKLEGKQDALVNLVTQLAANQKPASVARVYGIRSSDDHRTSFGARNNVIVFRGVQDMATNTSPETRMLEGKLDALVNFVTQLDANQKPTCVARVCDIRFSNDHRTSTTTTAETRQLIEKMALDSYQFSARNNGNVIRGVHDVPTDASAETRKMEGKLDALVNLVTQLVANQKPVSVARVCDIRSSNDHHTSVCPSSQQYRVDEHPEAYATNTYSRPPLQQRQGT
ncbi:hypothetical protein Fmac_018185 [Flemingia macrophylla]|uniref:Uncharacterized protein n=1 Tax=Flemingia macrophylla TaxID=520843 RepID=A0ABD1M490_9FABA